jgi:hypothetical protein
MVGVRGFEPPASSSRTRRATRLRHTPAFKSTSVRHAVALAKTDGRSERIRTSDPLIPNQVRYQAALRSEHDKV